MRDRRIPDLTFPMLKYGKYETPWDLRALLYKGGAKANVKNVASMLEAGTLGRPLSERTELVTRIHECLTAKLVGGGAKASAFGQINALRSFIVWIDQNSPSQLNLESVERLFRHWTDFLLNRVRLHTISAKVAYNNAAKLSTLLDEALERSTSLIKTTRLKYPRSGARAVGSVEADKQNLAETFAFGHLLLDIIDGLTIEALWGPLPVRITLRTGQVFEDWCRLRDPETLASLKPGYTESSNTRKVVSARSAIEADCTLRTRFPLTNLRVSAELLVFIAQTGMNLSQAHQLKVDQYSYKSTIDGYEVRAYKHRRRGEVLFEIFAEYRFIFERYLSWRKKVFPDSQELFPFVRTGGRATSTAPGFHMVQKICARYDIAFISASRLRKTRINWLLRQSRDEDMTAEQAQHTKETLLRVYEQPSQQVAMVEIIQFWSKHDPALHGSPMPSVAPGACDGVPQSIANIPIAAPKPDCSHPAGCLFCRHHRDIDSDDYVWSIASMRHLKTIVLRGFRPTKNGKVDAARHVELTIEALTAKLKWFRNSNGMRQEWVVEALERVGEANYHPHWRYLIDSAEGV